ncbi:ketopantoate reductase family protein [Rhodoplanes sp. Z2-YC6860]|uniref:ketopantoate reductase family protein n=1 Tax=Rhodoplanes sp. Z2-YC6860 TaxID=674703 RepID=UPI00078D56E4|nr:2-dehydropantoate 2-reductase [Rhodoplanes sp. Z2-YC6860]AMN45247.1 2-dehydropantoate 2-reductase [Rhodoplanes sp. Z2-YC6860]
MTNITESKIAVVGAGALGSYFGGLLARAGHPVTLIGRAGHVDAIKRSGLQFLADGSEQRISLAATVDVSAVRDASLVLFCVKSFDTEAAAAAIAPHLARDAVVLSLQNGVDNPERIGRHIRNQVIPVLVYVGANIPEPGVVRHTGGSNVVIGQLKAFRERAPDGVLLADIAATFSGAGLTVKTSDDIEADLWIKLLMNATYNAVSALGRSAYARMVAMPEVNAIMRDAAAEVVAVAKAKGICLPDDIIETAMKLADSMPQTRSSTAQDIAKGRLTEVAYLNGAVAEQGRALGVPTPVNGTLNALIKLLEQAGSAAPGG